jgi:hypothetical protein
VTIRDLLAEAPPIGTWLRALADRGWRVGGGGYSVQAAQVADAPPELRAWWSTPGSGRELWLADMGVPLLADPEFWVRRPKWALEIEAETGDRVLCATDRGDAVWRLDSNGRVAWVAERFDMLGDDGSVDVIARTFGTVPLEEWLRGFSLMQLIYGTADQRVGSFELHRLTRVLAPFAPIPLAAWPWPAYPTVFYEAEDLLAMVSPDKPGTAGRYEFRACARTPEAWNAIDTSELMDV